ncbi:hypothetical protein Hypma_005117 [Hypsizygus marmoreus]|uniref:Uncharacterized protein n=1 Tax=Hypsizygus marmoreus TaxID=39966 RepID=A0A369K0N2_HYPMA|nr:hypothetical protein Hypma_005117 [Hypsizygus marmoreus]
MRSREARLSTQAVPSKPNEEYVPQIDNATPRKKPATEVLRSETFASATNLGVGEEQQNVEHSRSSQRFLASRATALSRTTTPSQPFYPFSLTSRYISTPDSLYDPYARQLAQANAAENNVPPRLSSRWPPPHDLPLYPSIPLPNEHDQLELHHYLCYSSTESINGGPEPVNQGQNYYDDPATRPRQSSLQIQVARTGESIQALKGTRSHLTVEDVILALERVIAPLNGAREGHLPNGEELKEEGRYRGLYVWNAVRTRYQGRVGLYRRGGNTWVFHASD